MSKNRLITVYIGIVLFAICGLGSCIIKDPSRAVYTLKGEGYPAFSPDGKYIAYVHFGDYPNDGLYIINRDGSNKKLVLANAYMDSSPSWSPNGQWLVFSDGKHISKCKINGDSLISLTEIDSVDLYSPTWSKDNTRIVFAGSSLKRGVDFYQSNVAFYQSNVDFTNSKRLFGFGAGFGFGSELSPDGKSLVFFGSEFNYPNIYVSDNLGNHRLRLTDNHNFNYDPTWSPDGQNIAWHSNGHINVMDARGTNLKEIGNGRNPSWSINNEIVFAGPPVLVGKDDNYIYYSEHLFIISSEGKNKKQITF